MGEHRYVPGKVDFNKTGRRNCEAEFTWEMNGGQFSLQAAIWNTRHTDIYVGGQAVEEVASYFPTDAKAQAMLRIWRRWHLNHTRAGTPAQERFLREHPVTFTYPDSHYAAALRALEAAGLEPDNGYHYGSAWLREDLLPRHRIRQSARQRSKGASLPPERP